MKTSSFCLKSRPALVASARSTPRWFLFPAFGILKRLGCAVLLAATAFDNAAADELIVDGNFDSMSGWEELRIPRGAVREISEQNSPFTEVYPDNGKCLLIADATESTTAHARYLRQGVFTSSRTFEFSFDFKILEEPDASFGVSLLSGEEVILNVLIRPNFTLNLLHGPNRTPRWVLPKGEEVQHGVWHHFKCKIDLESATMEGELSSESGDGWGFIDHPIPVNSDNREATIDALAIGAHAGTNSAAPPTLMDNFSLRPINKE